MAATNVISRDALIKLIKDTAGTDVAEVVRAAVEQAVEPLRQQQTDWGRRVFEAIDHGEKKPDAERGLAFARCLRATAAAKMNGSGPNGAIGILRGWGDKELADVWAGAREKAMAAGDATAGGFLVPEQYSQEIIAFLRAQAIMRRLGARTIGVPTGTLNVPKLSGGAVANWIGETQHLTKTEPTTGQVTLRLKKLGALVPISNDLLRRSSPGADAIVRDDVVAAMRVGEDSAFLRANGTDFTPKGLRYWAVAANIVAAGATSLAQVTSDLGKLVNKLKGQNIPMLTPAWIMGPRSEQYLATVQNTNGFFVYRDEILRGQLWGWPVAVTTSVPENLTDGGNTDESEVTLVDMAQIVIGEGPNLMVDASQEAAYHDGTSVQAAFSLDQTVIRAIEEVDLVVRYDKAIAILNQVRWAP